MGPFLVRAHYGFNLDRFMAPALIRHANEWLRSRGMPRVMLWTADQNVPAQQLFTRLGFRPTMVEMTLELSPGQTHPA